MYAREKTKMKGNEKEKGGLTALRFLRAPMRSLDYRVKVTREVFPTSFFIEEVNEFLELFFLNEDECSAVLADDDFCLMIILGILQMLDSL